MNTTLLLHLVLKGDGSSLHLLLGGGGAGCWARGDGVMGADTSCCWGVMVEECWARGDGVMGADTSCCCLLHVDPASPRTPRVLLYAAAAVTRSLSCCGRRGAASCSGCSTVTGTRTLLLPPVYPCGGCSMVPLLLLLVRVSCSMVPLLLLLVRVGGGCSTVPLLLLLVRSGEGVEMSSRAVADCTGEVEGEAERAGSDSEPGDPRRDSSGDSSNAEAIVGWGEAGGREQWTGWRRGVGRGGAKRGV